MTIHTPTTDQIRSAWDALARRFDKVTTPEWTLPFGERVLRRVDLRPGVRFLDVACGGGALAIPAARRGADVAAVDIAPTMIERLRVRASAEGLSTIDGRIMNGEALELPDDTFDVSASLKGGSSDRCPGGRRYLGDDRRVRRSLLGRHHCWPSDRGTADQAADRRAADRREPSERQPCKGERSP